MRGVEPKKEMFDVSGMKATRIDELFEWMKQQEEITKEKFTSYEQLVATHEAFEKLSKVKQFTARLQGMQKQTMVGV